MTPKAEQLFNAFNTKLNTELYLYEQGFNTFEESKEGMRKQYNDFDTFLRLSLHYGTITPNEFVILSGMETFDLYIKKITILAEKHYNK